MILPLVTVASVTASLALAFFYAPTEALQGEVQRIFYVHVPAAWVAYLAFVVVAVASVAVVRRPQRWEPWDRAGVAAAEIGLMFTTAVLCTGPVWARRAWGVWWVWDARLTSTLILWAIYAGYLLYRRLTPPGPRRARMSAVIGIVGAVDIPVIHFSVKWWATLHPQPTVLRLEGPDLPGSMFLTLAASVAAFTLLFATLMRLRIGLEAARARIEELAHA